MELNTVRKHSYHMDLQALHAECETNYFRLIKLMPALGSEDRRHLALQSGTARERRFLFSVVERARYTTTIDITEFGERFDWGLSASFTARLYHDARMAEVITFQHYRNVAPACSYPNAQMLQRDEKTQRNFLLGEWLTYCLTHGYNAAQVFIPSTAGDCA
jgi:uncharacterized protein YqiB (DUF1249 family)